MDADLRTGLWRGRLNQRVVAMAGSHGSWPETDVEDLFKEGKLKWEAS
jgi:hypothetical protein